MKPLFPARATLGLPADVVSFPGNTVRSSQGDWRPSGDSGAKEATGSPGNCVGGEEWGGWNCLAGIRNKASVASLGTPPELTASHSQRHWWMDTSLLAWSKCVPIAATFSRWQRAEETSPKGKGCLHRKQTTPWGSRCFLFPEWCWGEGTGGVKIAGREGALYRSRHGTTISFPLNFSDFKPRGTASSLIYSTSGII